MNQSLQDVMAERERQIIEEGFGSGHDDIEERGGGMAVVAGLYSLAASGIPDTHPFFKEWWPNNWSFRWWKPTTPRRNLVKAAALIIAEIEWIDRATGGWKEGK